MSNTNNGYERIPEVRQEFRGDEEIEGRFDNYGSADNHDKKWLSVGSVVMAVGFFFYFAITGAPEDASPAMMSGSPSPSASTSRHHRGRHHPKYKYHDVDEEQYIDSIIDHNDPENSGTYKQRYFEELSFFGGPGHPIFVMMGGEDPVYDILYPVISETLGKKHKAYSMAVEHRFYGESQPVKEQNAEVFRKLLTPRQATEDCINLIKTKQKELGCGERGTPEYCPVMTVGASYPGTLAALLRMAYPDVVDIGYASSAPLRMYSHEVDQFVYYDFITKVADEESPGCAKAVRDTLYAVQDEILASPEGGWKDLLGDYGICTEKKMIPKYIQANKQFADDIVMLVATHFADNDMEYYPPGPDQQLMAGCTIFKDESKTPAERLSAFLRFRPENEECLDLRTEISPGPNATIASADWSGVGGDLSGWMWDFQTCYLLPECGFSEYSMFPPRNWTMDWVTEHCQNRFGYTPHLMEFEEEFGFGDLSKFSYLLFTNGLHDGWSAASYTKLPEHLHKNNIKIVNIPTGAHHSDLWHAGAEEDETSDLVEAMKLIRENVAEFLDKVKAENQG